MNYPGIGENEVIYAIGDIHGRADLLEVMTGRIDRAIASRPEASHLEIYLGDYIDRGPASAGVIRLLRERKARGEVVCLLGNHEAMLLDALNGALPIEHWLDNGGDATLSSYGLQPGGVLGWPGRSVLKRLPAEDIAFLHALRLTYRHGPYLFVHAGVRPGVPLDRQDPEDLIWIREGFLDFEGPLGAIVVHGHTPQAEPEFRPARINIDTKAVFSDRLTCLRIDRDGASIL